MELKIEEIKDVVVAKPCVKVIDSDNAKSFKTSLSDVIANNKKIVLDLSGVTFIDSSGCGTILACLRKLSANDGDLKVFGLQKPVRTLFELVRLHNILDIFENKEDAITSFK
ncbi:MAG: STAS domain-containing protein [Desulfobacterales bacterium]|nr:STAS domain-containing protein [Desulfobacterales bacterium]MBF0395576.1 STAS domain-containing protein [Desulfobacterales bacterium]